MRLASHKVFKCFSDHEHMQSWDWHLGGMTSMHNRTRQVCLDVRLAGCIVFKVFSMPCCLLVELQHTKIRCSCAEQENVFKFVSDLP